MRLSAIALASVLGRGIQTSKSTVSAAEIAAATTAASDPNDGTSKLRKRKLNRRNTETAEKHVRVRTFQRLQNTEWNTESAADVFHRRNHRDSTNHIQSTSTASFEVCQLPTTTPNSNTDQVDLDLDLGIMGRCSLEKDICILPNVIGFDVRSQTKTQGTDMYGDDCNEYYDYGYVDNYDADLDPYEANLDSYEATGICYPRASMSEAYLHARQHTHTRRLSSSSRSTKNSYQDNYNYSDLSGGGYNDRDLAALPNFLSRMISGKTDQTVDGLVKKASRAERIKQDLARKAITRKESHYLECKTYCADFDDGPDVGAYLVGKHPSGNWPMIEDLMARCILSREMIVGLGIESYPSVCPFDVSIPFQCWNMTGVTSLETAIRSNHDFNDPLGCWDVSSVTSTKGMFVKAYAFNQDIGMWDTGKVEDMSHMFYFDVDFNQNLDSWDTKSVTSMHSMFAGAKWFDGRIGPWDVSKVQTMDKMFFAATTFNQPLGGWNPKSMTSMVGNFLVAMAFNQPLNHWNTSQVTTMYNTFMNAGEFNQPLNAWDVRKVVDMTNTFHSATKFNQPLDKNSRGGPYWKVESATSMKQMFFRTSFNQCLGTWAGHLGNQTDTPMYPTHGMLHSTPCPEQGWYGTPDVDEGPWCQNATDLCFITGAILPELALASKNSKNSKSSSSSSSSRKGAKGSKSGRMWGNKGAKYRKSEQLGWK